MRFTIARPIAATLLTSAILFGCSDTPTTQDAAPTENEIVRTNLDAKVKEGMNDPDSYEFVSLVLMDSVTYGDNVEYRIEDWENNVASAERELEQAKKYRASYAEMKMAPPDHSNDEAIERLTAKVEKQKWVLEQVKELGEAIGERTADIASYTYLYKFRGNNAFGAKVLNEYMVQTGPPPSLDIINLATERNKLFLNPGDFPGYREAIGKMILN